MLTYSPISEHLKPLDPNAAYGLMNTGATAFICAAHEGDGDVMTCAWNCALSLNPTKVTAVVFAGHYTRSLMEKSGYFALALGAVGNVEAVQKLGCVSKNKDPEKLERSGVEFFQAPGWEMPLPAGCPAYFICRIVPEAKNESEYNLFIGELVAGWVDERAATEKGEWRFEDAPRALRTVHAASGGRYYAVGEAIRVAR